MISLDAFDYAVIAVVLVGLGLVLRRDVPKAYGLAATLLVVFAIQSVALFVVKDDRIATLGYSVDGLRQGAVWTILTSMFTHHGFGHILGNLFVLMSAGPALEARIGPRRFLLIYFLAGIGALVAHTILALTTPIVTTDAVAVGASGAIFGVLTTFAVRHPRERLPLILGLLFVWMPAFVVLLVYLGLNVYYMLASGTGIAWWGHFAGFLVGLPFAYVLKAHVPEAAPRQGSTRGLPDPDKLAPFASSFELREILDRIRQFTPEARTAHDAPFVDAWLDRFFAKATCDKGHPFERAGMTATCSGGETQVHFACDSR